METLGVYLSMDRRHALARSAPLPDRAHGAVLFADICGFTPLTEALARALGPRLGAEELTRQLNRVYDALIAEVDRFGGSVVGFSGDSITCWFSDNVGLEARDLRLEETSDIQASSLKPQASPAALRAVACALAMQLAIRRYAETVPSSSEPAHGATREIAALGIKVAVTSGPARRFLVGDPALQLFDILAGATLTRIAAAEHLASMGDVMLDEQTTAALGALVQVSGWRADPATGQRFAVAQGLLRPVEPMPWPPLDAQALAEPELRPWLLPVVYTRLRAGQGDFLTELRPAVALFVRFEGIDYEGDEAAGAKLDTYLRWSQEVLAHYDGTLIQLTIGDKGSYLYGAFGAPHAHEDDARRAVAAARELATVPPMLTFITSIQIGISQGTIRTGAYGGATRRTYGVLGDEVNLAARLMQLAPPGQVIASARIATATADAFVWESLPPITIKGKGTPVATARLVAEIARSQARDRRHSALIGRSDERMLLDELFDALRDPRIKGSAVVAIEGEAGIGKSRLVSSLWEHARARGATTLLGEGDAIEQTTLYYVWRGVFSQLFGLATIADPDAQRQRVLSMVELTLGQPQLAPLLSPVLPFTLPDNDQTAQLTGQERADQTRELLVQLLQNTAREAPMVLILDDVHWLDSASWALALAVGRQVRPLLFVLAARPLDDTAPPEHRQLLELPEARRLRLDALSPADTLALVCQRLNVAALPKPAAALIVEKSQGNPFFGEQLAYALRDSGLLIVNNGTCELAPEVGDLRAVHFPDTVQGVITSRIDRLAPSQQLAIKVASVIGRLFAFQTLRDIYPVGIDLTHLDEDLRDLEHLDLTQLESPAPDLAYIFKHIITQEVAYNLLLFAQRRALHRAVAEWYERTFEDLSSFYSVLGHHWGRAEVVTKAVNYLKKAALQASYNGLPREAVHFGLEAARMLGVTLPTDNQEIGPAIGAEMAEIQHLMAGRAPADLIDLPPLTDESTAMVIDILHMIMPAAHNSLQPALFALMVLKNVSLTLKYGHGDLAPDVYALYAVALHAMTGDSRLAYEFSRLALELDARQGSARTASVTFLHTYFINHWVNPIETGLELSLAGSSAGLEHGDLEYGCFNTAAYVVFLSVMGAPLDQVASTAAKHSRIIDNRVASAAFHCRHELQMAKALAARTIDRLSFTDDEYDEERDIASIAQTANYTQIGFYFVSKLKLHYYYQQYEAALDYGDKALPLLPAFQGQPAEPELVFFHALALLARSAEVAPEARSALLEQAGPQLAKLAGWSATCAANFEHKLLLARAEHARIEGRVSEAMDLYHQAAESAETFNYIQHAALAYELAGRCSLEQGDVASGQEHFEAARQRYARWGARAKIEHLSELTLFSRAR